MFTHVILEGADGCVGSTSAYVDTDIGDPNCLVSVHRQVGSVSCTAKAKVNSNMEYKYEFVGWYNNASASDPKLSGAEEYKSISVSCASENPSSPTEKHIYAKFKEKDRYYAKLVVQIRIEITDINGNKTLNDAVSTDTTEKVSVHVVGKSPTPPSTVSAQSSDFTYVPNGTITFVSAAENTGSSDDPVFIGFYNDRDCTTSCSATVSVQATSKVAASPNTKTIYAKFAKSDIGYAKLIANANPPAGGNVNVGLNNSWAGAGSTSSKQTSAAKNSTVQFQASATAKTDWVFSSWSPNDFTVQAVSTNSSAPSTKIVTANFIRNYYGKLKAQVSTNSNGFGTVCAQTVSDFGSGTYGSSSTSQARSSTVNTSTGEFWAKAIANPGYKFVGWSSENGSATYISTSDLIKQQVQLSGTSGSPTMKTIYANFEFVPIPKPSQPEITSGFMSPIMLFDTSGSMGSLQSDDFKRIYRFFTHFLLRSKDMSPYIELYAGHYVKDMTSSGMEFNQQIFDLSNPKSIYDSITKLMKEELHNKFGGSEAMLTLTYSVLANLFCCTDLDRAQGGIGIRCVPLICCTDESIFTSDSLQDYDSISTRGWINALQTSGSEAKLPTKVKDFTYAKLNNVLKQMSYYWGVNFTFCLVWTVYSSGGSPSSDIKKNFNEMNVYSPWEIDSKGNLQWAGDSGGTINSEKYYSFYFPNKAKILTCVNPIESGSKYVYAETGNRWYFADNGHNPEEIMFHIKLNNCTLKPAKVLSEDDMYTSTATIKGKFHKVEGINGIITYSAFRFSGDTITLPSIDDLTDIEGSTYKWEIGGWSSNGTYQSKGQCELGANYTPSNAHVFVDKTIYMYLVKA